MPGELRPFRPISAAWEPPLLGFEGAFLGTMAQEIVGVAVAARTALDRAALMALIASLPGLRVAPLDSDPPPRVLVWDVGPGDLATMPHLAASTALLLLVSGEEPPALPSGATGLFSKDETAEALGAAIRQVARGEQYLSPALALALLRRQPSESTLAQVELSALTDREREILALLSNGLSNKAIAARLYLSVRTVEGHLAHLYTRLGVHSRTEAMALAVRHGLTARPR